jgi:hypothetical protein
MTTSLPSVSRLSINLDPRQLTTQYASKTCYRNILAISQQTEEVPSPSSQHQHDCLGQRWAVGPLHICCKWIYVAVIRMCNVSSRAFYGNVELVVTLVQLIWSIMWQLKILDNNYGICNKNVWPENRVKTYIVLFMEFGWKGISNVM